MGMINWGNGLSEAGYAAGKIGVEGIKNTFEQDKIRLVDQLAGAREVATDARRENIRREGRMSDIDQDTDPEVIRKKGVAASGLINATTEAEANKRKRFADVDTQQKVDEFTKLAPLKRQDAIDTAVAQVTALATPEMLAATRSIALAKHIVDPSYTLIPNADGTVTTFDSKSGKSSGVLNGPDGKPIIRKDPEEMKAAVSVINMANTNLKIAQAAFKAAEADPMGDPGAKATAAAEWRNAQEEAKRLTAPAYAVLYAKAKIPGETEAPATAPGGMANPKSVEEAQALPPGTRFMWEGREYKVREKSEAKAPAAGKNDEPAKPKEETVYARTKNNRGGWDYSPATGRFASQGKTRAEWTALDAQ